VHNQSYYGGEYEVLETPGTTHVSALDKSGLAVSLTSTVRAKMAIEVRACRFLRMALTRAH